MYRTITAIMAFLTFGLVAPCVAQTASLDVASYAQATSSKSSSLLKMDNEDWSLYADEENQLYYVDFATLSVNLNDVVVTRNDGEVVLRDDLFGLPVDTIYEIDFSQYGPGKYTIELRSFTGSIRREVTIK